MITDRFEVYQSVGALTFVGSTGTPAGPHGGWHRNPLEQMTQSLNLTADQQAKVQPIIHQAKPQLQAIHQDVAAVQRGQHDGHRAFAGQARGYVVLRGPPTHVVQLQAQRRQGHTEEAQRRGGMLAAGHQDDATQGQHGEHNQHRETGPARRG